MESLKTLEIAERIEDESSVGRSYSARIEPVPGLGAKRAALRSVSFKPSLSHLPESLQLGSIHLSQCTRDDVRNYFLNTWQLTECLFGALRDDSVFYMVPDRLRRPLIFYFAHPAALYANKMSLCGLFENVDLYYQRLFETGVDELIWDASLEEPDFPWPDVSETMAFRDAVRDRVLAVIDAMPNPCDEPVTMSSPYWALFMAFEHERIHFETSTVLIRMLPIDCIVVPPGWTTAPSYALLANEAPSNSLVDIPARVTVLGKPRDYPSFGWDNEYGRREVSVPGFSVSKYLISNAEYLPFVLDGGYNKDKYWISAEGSDEGLRWKRFRNAKHPIYWIPPPTKPEYFSGTESVPYQKDTLHIQTSHATDFMYRNQFSIIEMPWDWPVEVNNHEACAYLRWRSEREGRTYRLPTEAEWHVYRGDPEIDSASTVAPFPNSVSGNPAEEDPSASFLPPMARYDVAMLPKNPHNSGLKYGSPSPVHAGVASRYGVYDALGNVADWTMDHFAPFDDTFTPHRLYSDFSSPCFGPAHNMQMGGGWMSTGQLVSSFARYQFRRHFWFCGFRLLCSTESPDGAAVAVNCDRRLDSVYNRLTNGFGTPEAILPPSLRGFALDSGADFAPRLALRLHTLLSQQNVDPASIRKILHLGSSAGSVSLNIAAQFPNANVVALEKDLTTCLKARVLLHHSEIAYAHVTEGCITTETSVALPQFLLPVRNRVLYVHGDAAALPALLLEPGVGPFDLILIDNVLTKVRSPVEVVQQFFNVKGTQNSYLNERSVLAIVSDNDWSQDVSPPVNWLGGFLMNGEEFSTTTCLSHTLKGWKLAAKADEPKTYRISNRRVVTDLMEVSVWTQE